MSQDQDDYAARVAAINTSGARRRAVMGDAKKIISQAVKRVRDKLAKKFPGESFDKEVAEVCEGVADAIRGEHHDRERARRAAARAETIAKEDRACRGCGNDISKLPLGRTLCGGPECGGDVI